MAIFHSVRFCARSQQIFRDLKSLSTAWYQTFRGLPFLCCSSITISFHFFTSLSLHLSKWPNHLKLFLLITMQFLMLTRSKCSLSSEEDFLSFKVILHIHLIILVSLCSNLNIYVSLLLPNFYTCNTCLVYTLSINQGRNPY